MGGDSSKSAKAEDPSRFSCARPRKEAPPTPPKAAPAVPNVKLSKGAAPYRTTPYSSPI